LGSSAGAPLTEKAATFTAVVPTSTPMMTSVIRVFMSLGLDGAGLTNNSVDKFLVAAEPGFENL
jgi:sporulation-control protein spo0M